LPLDHTPPGLPPTQRFHWPAMCKEILKKAGLERTSMRGVHGDGLSGARGKVVLATGCSGASAISFAMRGLVGDDFEEVFSSDNSLHCAQFNIIHCKPHHMFSDIGAASQPGNRAYCFVHNGRLCSVPNTRQDLFVAGFVCKPFSIQNNKRFRATRSQNQGPSSILPPSRHVSTTSSFTSPSMSSWRMCGVWCLPTGKAAPRCNTRCPSCARQGTAWRFAWPEALMAGCQRHGNVCFSSWCTQESFPPHRGWPLDFGIC